MPLVADPPSKPAPRSLKNGNPAHVLTAEDRRKGALARAEKARLAARSALDVAREKVEQEGERLVKPYLDAMDAGDWRAAEALIDRIYGKPGQAGVVGTADLEPGDTMEVRRLLVEAVSVTKSLIPPSE